MAYVRKHSVLLSTVLAASSMIFNSAAPAAKPVSAAKPHRFNVGGTMFGGMAKTICVIEGTWKDGEHFRFEAWDECGKMLIRRVPAGSYQNSRSLGSADEHTVSDIPAGSEVLEVSNDYSSVLLFRDAGGVMREILTRD